MDKFSKQSINSLPLPLREQPKTYVVKLYHVNSGHGKLTECDPQPTHQHKTFSDAIQYCHDVVKQKDADYGSNNEPVAAQIFISGYEYQSAKVTVLGSFVKVYYYYLCSTFKSVTQHTKIYPLSWYYQLSKPAGLDTKIDIVLDQLLENPAIISARAIIQKPHTFIVDRINKEQNHVLSLFP